MNFPHDILAARARLRPHLRETPLEYSLALSQQTGAEVWLKLENLQHTGSFKARGAMNKLLSLSPAQLAKGVVAASSGNHGAALAWGLSKLGAKGTVFVPEKASPTKLAAIRRYGAEVRVFGTTGDDTEVFARQHADERGLTYVSPYNDPEVIAGQGTIGVEIAEQMADLGAGTTGPFSGTVGPLSLRQPDAVFVTVGGGGMVSGIAAYLKSVSPNTKIIGCQPENDAAMLASVRAGRVVEVEARETISDGSAGGLEPGSITLDLCTTLVDEWVTAGEDTIKAAMRQFIETQHQLLEGAAGVALAALLETAQRYEGKTVVVVICGANIAPQTLKDVL